MQNLPETILPFRVHMKEHEYAHPWLSLLLDCYAVIDFSVAEAIRHAEKKPACHEGCISCCYHLIPLSTLECFGLKWYVRSMLNREQQTMLRRKLQERKKVLQAEKVSPFEQALKKAELCLFNVNGACLVYALRPIACRRYLVCSKACEIGEDATASRADDVLKPAREYLYMAIRRTLPFYEALNIPCPDRKHLFAFYKQQNVLLSSFYDNILF